MLISAAATTSDYSPSPAGYVNTAFLILITLLISVVGYWVRRQDKRTDLLELTVHSLDTTVAVLGSTVSALKDRVHP